MYSLLNVATSWSKYITDYITEDPGHILIKVFNIIEICLWVVLGVVGAIGAVYAIYLGVKLARADEQGKRDDARKHLITVCIAVGATLALIIFFNTLLPMIISAFSTPLKGDINFNPGGPGILLPF